MNINVYSPDLSLLVAGEHSDSGTNIITDGVGLLEKIVSSNCWEAGNDFRDFSEFTNENEHVLGGTLHDGGGCTVLWGCFAEMVNVNK